MRLLTCNSDGEFSLTEHFGDNMPRYAILSHTWGADGEEVTFHDLVNGTGKHKEGYNKIRFCGEQARCDGLQYFWVDTCCIDKSNSTELAEAINSMFRWYRNAAKCYVYLSDVATNEHGQVDLSKHFSNARWFTRGWTLQELIAPRSVEFFCSNRRRLGDKKSLERQLHKTTGIAVLALQGTPLSAFGVEDRMLWAAKRQTKCEEDKAYSLLGIFDVSMPLIYGEGAEKAFERLKDELFKRSRKHQLDELSPVSHTFHSTKRLQTLRSQSSSMPPGFNPKVLDPKAPFYSEHSMDSDNSPETGKEPCTSNNATTKQSLIDRLYFTKIDERLTSLTAGQRNTCDWFLTKPEYRSWHDVAQQPDHSGLLWIKGNPGTGKSTLMKFLFEEAKHNAEAGSSQIVLSFFFLARGTVEERSTTGLYRSLLHQLFEKAANSRDGLEWMTADGARGIERNGWHESALQQTLMHAVQKLGSQSLIIFVDALDECDKSQATGMIYFFEELCACARKAQVRLQICFSSRHYPTIVIQKGIEVILEDEIGHTEDIKRYIESRLRVGTTKQAELLRSEILETSSNIFLWVVLVLDILNSEYPDSSISIKKIRGRLKEIPPRLTDLFEMILTRDSENLERLEVCLKWILFAARPLKLPELYFAIQLSLDNECSGFWDQDDVGLDQMKLFVRSSSKGLAEVTRGKASEVQFIHESVRDFLLGKYEGQWSGASGNFVGHSHEALRNCCLAQLNAPVSQVADIPSPLPPGLEAAELRMNINLKFPFLEYSILNIFYHANGAQLNRIEQGDFLADFPLIQWIFLNNILEKSGNWRYTESASLLYILAEKNLADLIRIHPQREFCFEVEDERYEVPSFAALATESYEAVRTFLQVQAEIHPEKPLLRLLSEQYSENRNRCSNFHLTFYFSWHRGVASHAAEQGEEVVLLFLSALNKLDIKQKDRLNRTPLSWAASNGHEAVVKLLLEKGAKLGARNKRGQTLLWYAIDNGHEAVVELLLEKGAEINIKDNSGRTPLWWAASTGYEAIVKLLLKNSAEVDAKNYSGQTPLWCATRYGHEAIIKLLLEKGADPNIKDSNNQTPLWWASNNFSPEISSNNTPTL
ncbi:hypothetical protein B7494_g866 [Chlorociboria aeruginascens]|nr:hypothetical protein B7494_g866 [Chlorociboria aeruginascens]